MMVSFRFFLSELRCHKGKRAQTFFYAGNIDLKSLSNIVLIDFNLVGFKLILGDNTTYVIAKFDNNSMLFDCTDESTILLIQINLF